MLTHWQYSPIKSGDKKQLVSPSVLALLGELMPSIHAHSSPMDLNLLFKSEFMQFVLLIYQSNAKFDAYFSPFNWL